MYYVCKCVRMCVCINVFMFVCITCLSILMTNTCKNAYATCYMRVCRGVEFDAGCAFVQLILRLCLFKSPSICPSVESILRVHPSIILHMCISVIETCIPHHERWTHVTCRFPHALCASAASAASWPWSPGTRMRQRHWRHTGSSCAHGGIWKHLPFWGCAGFVQLMLSEQCHVRECKRHAAWHDGLVIFGNTVRGHLLVFSLLTKRPSTFEFFRSHHKVCRGKSLEGGFESFIIWRHIFEFQSLHLKIRSFANHDFAWFTERLFWHRTAF